jgi:hypothetical protein
MYSSVSSVYVELADQYKEMDPVSDVPRRNMLAKHLKEVVDILEQKVRIFAGDVVSRRLTDRLSQGDQIASLSDLLAFKDKPPSGSRK